MLDTSRLIEIGICVSVIGLVVASKQFRSIYRVIPPFYTVCVALAFLLLFGGHLYRQSHLTFPFVDWPMYANKVAPGSMGLYDEYFATLDDGYTVALSPAQLSITGRKMIFRLENAATAIVRKAYGHTGPIDNYDLKPSDEYVKMLRGVAILYGKKNGDVKVRSVQVIRCWLPMEKHSMQPIRRKLWTVDMES